ncbi:uncharacterized protein LACBIDRAFT_334446 [Laccaria bicolor S238N-H82]|uniref:Predicted protein n=1 Tax=Laccaria bicolor (strain S238N-H82 / ATCC MYA-4686) TaxID=486041 RepID=B0DZ88_LACBS|nr:uncharacterized protein LACBIDRAFT_334446 [Laccaria bicolor S238N-H82]EDR00047.1 predicted protein [Laccaria bicolor S238N-H82]|eukprot:XP_001889253.1 predicted protein [Laccaria bicolor S238N-H82]
MLKIRIFRSVYLHSVSSRDPTLYQALLTAYEQTSNALDMPLPNPLDLAQLDTKWMDKIIAKTHILRQPYFSLTATPAEHAHHCPTAQIAAHLGQNAEHLGHRSHSNTMRTVMGRMHIIVCQLKLWGTL